MNSNCIKVELGTVKITRGKQEYSTKPAASALGITEASHTSPITRLLNRLLDEGKICAEDHVVVVRGDMVVFQQQAVSKWLSGEALGRKPGACAWLRQAKHNEE